MPNLREKTWTTTTPANVEDAQYWEDHLISDEDAAKIGTVILPAGGTAGQVLTKQSSSPNDADWDDPASSGHTIEDEDGVVMPYQSTLQFVNAEVTNDSTNGRTVVDCKGAKGDAATVDAGTVTTLPAGSSATVVNSGTTSDAIFDFGIPRGADGTDGTDGEDGFSPAVTITTIPGGHQVNITDAEHPQGQSFDVMDGGGAGDMLSTTYDSDLAVANAGGIADYIMNIIASEFDATESYEEDDYVIYNHDFYKCINDHTGAWAAADFEKTTVGQELTNGGGGGGMVIVQIPSVVGDTFTYDGTAQGPTVTGLDSEHCTVTGATATNAGTYTLTIALNNPNKMVWSDLTNADKTYSYTIGVKSITIPTVSANLVYDGTAQSPTITNPDSSWITTSGDTSATNAGTYTVTFTLDDDTNTEWTDETTAAKSATWSIAKASQTITASKASVSLDMQTPSDTVTISGQQTSINVSSSDTGVATVSESSGVVTITAVDNGNATVSVYAESSANYEQSNTVNISVAVALVPSIYGVSWDGTSTSAWTRTDDAALFIDPVPQMSNGSGGWTTGSSPFDTISPWKDMVVSERTGGTMVAIPKFYFKLTKTGSAMSIKIVDGSNSTWALANGYQISPAHMDRGDGNGERDVVYVGKYTCSNVNATKYKSVSGVAPITNVSRATARTGIHNLGSNIWQFDFAMWITIQLLYLVEFADFNIRNKIGFNNLTTMGNTGATDSMTYHTGTTSTSTSNSGRQRYRNIEDLWNNIYYWCDGIRFDGTNVYVIKNPSDFSDDQNGALVGTRSSANNYIIGFNISNTEGYTWVMIPVTSSSASSSTYVTCYSFYGSTSKVLVTGWGLSNEIAKQGLFFYHGTNNGAGSQYESCKIMELP